MVYEHLSLVTTSLFRLQFLPTEWLQKYFDTPTSAAAIDTSPFLCAHGNLDLDSITQVRRVHINISTFSRPFRLRPIKYSVQILV